MLHSKELTRPNIARQKEFGILTSAKVRNSFYEEVNNLVQMSNFKIISHSINKSKIRKAVGNSSIDLSLKT